jgi:luciferase family oxidoreductase group 1
MLPNHAPLVIAEQFGTLASLHPGRIDLGLGRAPGTDQRTLLALRRTPMSADTFPQDVLELQAYLSGPQHTGAMEESDPARSRRSLSEPGRADQGHEARATERGGAVAAAKPHGVEAVPGAGTNVPIWILGSSLFGAALAAELGLPYAFASHFAPAALLPAIAAYRRHFKSSRQLDRPYVMAGINVVAADTDEEARRLFTSAQQAFTHAVRGTRGQLPPPIDDIERYWTPMEKAQVSTMLSVSFVGSPRSVLHGLATFIDRTGVDELIVAAAIYDHGARLRSYELLADVAIGDPLALERGV